MNLYERIPNNVNLSEDKKLQRALEKWLPNYLDWWQEMGPDGFQEKDVYLRTAISVEPDGWANFDFVKMPDYRWGIFLKPAEPENATLVLARKEPFNTEEAEVAGLITFAPDDLDWEDEIRVAIEERTSLSPDALTGMEASLRFAGPETMDTKIYGRLTAWQNWIFQRPNAVGPEGALTNYGKPTQAHFDYKRT